MTSSAPRPPGRGNEGRRPPTSVGGLTSRLAVGATILSFCLIVLQTSWQRAASPGGADAAPDEGGYAAPEPAPATRTASPAPRDPRLVPFHGLLDGVKDYEEVAQNQAYAKLADHVRRLSDEDAARVVVNVSFTALLREPHLYRGELVQATGLLINLEPIRLVPGAGPPGVEDAWRGILMDPEGDEAWIFDFAGDRPDIDKRALARVEGNFLKVVRYERKQRQGIGYVVQCETTGSRYLLLLPRYRHAPVEGVQGDDLPRVVAGDAEGRPVLDEAGQPDVSKFPSPWGGRGKAVEVAYLTTRDAPFLIARRVWQLSDPEIQAERGFRYDYVVVALLAVAGLVVFLQGKRAADEQTLLEIKRAQIEQKLRKKKDNA